MKKSLLFLIVVAVSQTLPMAATNRAMSYNDMENNSKVEAKQTNFELKHLPTTFNSPLKEGRNDAPNIISEVPEGDMRYYIKESAGYVVDWTTFREHETEGGARIVFAEDGEVYFDNFFSNLISPAWIKGNLSEDGKSIRVDFPQDYYILPDSEYWGILNRGTVKYENNAVECTVDTENNYVTFLINEDGSIDMEEGAEVVMMWNDDTFSGFSDNIQYFIPTKSPLSMPESVKTEEWALLYGNTGRFVEIGENNNLIYIKGFSENFPESVVMGEINNDIIEVSARQFLGLYETHFMYLMFGYINDDDFVELLDPNEKFKFNYDRASQTITPENPGLIWLVNVADESLMYAEALSNPHFKNQGKVMPAAPATPELLFYDDSQFEQLEESYLWFSLPPFNVNGDLIHTNDYYYTIYIDDEPYVFYGDWYPVLGEMGIEEITDIPYNMELGSGLAVMGIYRGVVLLCGYMDKIDVQSYIVIDGEKYYSEKMTIAFTGVDVIEQSANILSTEYYNLDGTRSNADIKGLIIQKTIMSDGSIKVSKILR
ncbi:MAG: hypothetical protein K2K26_02915 [Muribaculaceae bacterium]|nr:hypothetical protein [Muribaculaceae bacterium]